MESIMENLYRMGLNDLPILENILVYVHPLYLYRIRRTCKLFDQAISSLTSRLYKEWVIDLPLEVIKAQTKNWKPQDLVKCALQIHPIGSMKLLSDKEKEIAVENSLKRGEIDLSYFHIINNNYWFMHKCIYYIYKHGHKQMMDKLESQFYDSSYVSSFIEMLKTCFQHPKSPRSTYFNAYSGFEIINLYIIDSTCASIEEIFNLLEACFVNHGRESWKSDIKEGIEYKGDDIINFYDYKDLGHKLTYLFEPNKLSSLLDKFGIKVCIPERDLTNIELSSPIHADKWSFDPQVHYKSMSMIKSKLATYRPDIYIKYPQLWMKDYNEQVFSPYYSTYIKNYTI